MASLMMPYANKPPPLNIIYSTVTPATVSHALWNFAKFAMATVPWQLSGKWRTSFRKVAAFSRKVGVRLSGKTPPFFPKVTLQFSGKRSAFFRKKVGKNPDAPHGAS